FFYSDGYVRRYGADGAPDSAFAGSGTAAVHAREFTGLSDVNTRDGLIYVSGYTTNSGIPRFWEGVIARLDDGGGLDTGWAGDGVLQTPGATWNGSTTTLTGATEIGAVVADGAGHVYAAGGGNPTDGGWIYRYDTGGHPDPSWDSGLGTTPFSYGA